MTKKGTIRIFNPHPRAKTSSGRQAIRLRPHHPVRFLALFLLILFNQKPLPAQWFNCDSLIHSYLTAKAPLITRVDTPLFCETASAALLSDQPSIWQPGNPEHVSGCRYWSYEKWGVRLEVMGEGNGSQEMFRIYSYHNFATEGRIRKMMGDDYEKFAQVYEAWFVVGPSLINKVFRSASLEMVAEDTVRISLTDSSYAWLKALRLRDVAARKYQPFTRLWKGMLFPVRSGLREARISIDLIFDTTYFDHPLFCKCRLCLQVPVSLTFPRPE